MMWVVDYLADKWIKACPHADNAVAADILEGGGSPYGQLHGSLTVAYCRRCGSVRIDNREWRRPEPLAPDGYTAKDHRRLRRTPAAKAPA